ncbi:hypothetical protein CN126_14480 [Sinorhizobium meliloti]|uniref:hypothetical protein n=1 Tax=Rhizobium meliloti TaxID=382 RepID=UPI000FD9F364|nr:hypothetical protein [Sinorhizobium meliloti]RVK59165.1 hypothetical protein CN162_07705 [Sinorhizobium meliloti]RVM76219.1 hypothetical protein CN126_14480 [Sinorhizobium meliloti]RVM95315.1 hypothetical protein CN122_06520 [Sinorhizobium meliloti]RVN74719.1 hypothetical protein CN110_09145 [Sinorhizobium meliloti]
MFDEFKYGYYQTLRVEARSRIVNALNRRIKSPEDRERWRGITLASINADAYEYARTEWAKYYGDETHRGLPHSWERLFFQFTAKPAHFNLAVWQTIGENKILQGLALGKPSGGKNHLTINWVERSYAPTYFRGGVLLPVLACAQEYAKLLGCQRVLVKDPVDAAVFAKYGYEPYSGSPKGGSYLFKELQHG